MFRFRIKSKFPTGFTLMEAVVGVAIFAILLVGIIGVYTALTRAVKVSRERTVITALADNYLEIVRNLPYSQVGTVAGNPNGNLPDSPNPVTITMESTLYRIYYEITYVDDPADGTIAAGTDPAPNDYKDVKMFVENTATGVISYFLTTVSPQGLESMENAGALIVNVFDSQGQPVSGANVHIENLIINPNIIVNRSTDATGRWIEVGLPESVNGYHIVVSKAGYSSDQTYPITPQNPNPIKPDATIVNGEITEVSLFIDLLSNLTVRTLDQFCQPQSGVDVNIRGDKLIGTAPDVYKLNQDFTSAAGQIVLNSIEWDTYTPTLLTGQNLFVRGTSPIQKITVLPGTSQVFTIILGNSTTDYSLLVIVKDAATGTALEGANVHLIKGGSTPQDYFGMTGGSVWVQTDWTAGPGQGLIGSPDRYFVDDGNIDINSVPTGVRLNKIAGRYVASGWLESSTFDTGTVNTDYTTLTFEPQSQSPDTLIRFQVASNNDMLTWDYLGPDGTPGTYYTVSGTTLNPIHDNDRYIRYKVYLDTTDDKKTPVITSMNINYVSGCSTPGQAFFPDLTVGNNYDLEVTLAGYQDFTVNSLDITTHNVLEVLMSP
ncbi:MAG: hypothetical protein AAB871_00315 [Patescibacteria group bacterium]